MIFDRVTSVQFEHVQSSLKLGKGKTNETAYENPITFTSFNG